VVHVVLEPEQHLVDAVGLVFVALDATHVLELNGHEDQDVLLEVEPDPDLHEGLAEVFTHHLLGLAFVEQPGVHN